MKVAAQRARAALNALGLRWKIAALLAAGCAVVAVAIGILVHQARLEQVSANARSGATAQLVRVRQLYELTGQVDTAGDDVTHAAIDAPGLPASLRAAALDGRRTTYLDMGAADPVVWAARPVGGHVLSVCEPLTEQAAEMDEFDEQLMISGAVVVILAALGGAALASRLSRELRTAAATARRISQGDLDARIDHPRSPGSRSGSRPGRDEVAELAAAVDTMAASLQQRLEAEQRFTADVAHELRTPLTGLHTAAELLPQSRPTELVRDRVSALRVLTEDLLEVARLDAEVERPELDVHPLGRLTEGIVQRSGYEAGFAAVADPATEPATDPVADPVADPADTLVRTDARRLERIIANLVANARRHGADPVDVRVAGPVVTVTDHGPGFPEHLLKDGPQRFKTGARERGQGTGLGLTIAFGQAQVIGARVELSNAEGGGAVASVHLPEA